MARLFCMCLQEGSAFFYAFVVNILSKYIKASKKIAEPDIVKNINANAIGYELLLKKQMERGR